MSDLSKLEDLCHEENFKLRLERRKFLDLTIFTVIVEQKMPKGNVATILKIEGGDKEGQQEVINRAYEKLLEFVEEVNVRTYD